MLSGSAEISQSLKPGASQPAVAPVGLQAPAHKARGQSPSGSSTRTTSDISSPRCLSRIANPRSIPTARQRSHESALGARWPLLASADYSRKSLRGNALDKSQSSLVVSSDSCGFSNIGTQAYRTLLPQQFLIFFGP
jgi:hypothetical protein